MTKEIEFTEEVKIGDTVIDKIEVEPLTFQTLVTIWEKAGMAKSRGDVVLQRSRFLHQTHFMNDGQRIEATEADLSSLPLKVAKSILAVLDLDQGKPGKVIQEGDGCLTPIVYKLGSPIRMKTGDGKEVSIEELEFLAKTYGEAEEVLAAGNELAQTLALLRTVAKPVGLPSLLALPGWAIDKISVSDSLTLMRTVLPNF